MRARIACDALMASFTLDNLPKILTVATALFGSPGQPASCVPCQSRLMGAQLLQEDVGVAHRWGQLSADIGHDGADLLIAATALERGLTVVKHNLRHFESDEPYAPLPGALWQCP